MPDPLPLAGLTVVVTRPRQQGESTAGELRAAGADVIEMPALEIVPLNCDVDATMLSRAGAVIFVSANAVEHGVSRLRDALSGKVLIAAIGNATTRALNEAGFANVVSPQQSIDSEGLLAMPQLQAAQVKGQHIVLVRGKSASGGRKLIEETLIARGAEIVVMECYERRTVAPGPGQIESLLQAAAKPGFALMALSVETLESLMDSLKSHELLLKSQPLLVPHARVAAAAAARGFTRVHEIAMSSGQLVPALLALKPGFVAATATR